MKKIIFIGLMIIAASMFVSCYWNVDNIKANANTRLGDIGFTIVGTEGTKMSITGGKIWYILKSQNNNDIGLYDACLSYMFSGEIGIYELKPINTINVNMNNSK